jgi:two-component system, sensor histidine kinase and response regulator
MNKAKVLQVLIISNSPTDVNTIKKILENCNNPFNFYIAGDENKYQTLLGTVSFDIILADYDFPFLSASNMLKLALAHQHDVPFICISGLIGEDKAVELMKQGAFDVVIKDRIARLPSAVTRAVKEAKMTKQLNKAKNQLRDKKIIKAQNEELKKINEAKDRFFSIIAHDLKSPLNSLLGFSSILSERAKEKKYDECERIADIIHQSSTRAVTLLSNLLSWAQTQVGNIEFQPEFFNFAELAEQVENYMKDAAQLKNIVIVNKLPPAVHVYADKEMMASVLRNLLTNAVKFTHPGGTVTISSRQSGNELTLSVSDTGVGIPANKMKELFQIGRTNSTYGTSKESGTGLGLILCREFVSLHQGKIWAESKAGSKAGSTSGSTFHFSIPSLIQEDINV